MFNTLTPEREFYMNNTSVLYYFTDVLLSVTSLTVSVKLHGNSMLTRRLRYCLPPSRRPPLGPSSSVLLPLPTYIPCLL